MGQSTAFRSDRSPLARFIPAEKFVEPAREVDDCIDEDGRRSYLAIARRAQEEAVNLYATLAIGLEMYRVAKRTAAGS